MAFGEGKIWFDGKFVDWKDATCHVLVHALHYGTMAFEGMRCYNTKKGPAVFRLVEHIRRLYDSCKIYRIAPNIEINDFTKAVIETVKINGLKDCYIRPFFFRGYHSLGVNPLNCPVHGVIAVWEWGAYLGEEALENGAKIKFSSWTRPAPNTLPSMAKIAANYMNSQLIKMEAIQDGYDEGIALNVDGHVSECSGENIFMVRDGVIFTPPVDASILPGITRNCVYNIAEDLGITIKSHNIPREALYVADEVFLSGTAAEVTPVSYIDGMKIGEGKRGPITKKIQDRFFAIIKGETEDTHNWLTYVQ
jgi:branched-chain amino acid aminotransferase